MQEQDHRPAIVVSMAILLAGIIISLSIFYASNSITKKLSNTAVGTTGTSDTAAESGDNANKPTKTTFSNNAVMGNKDTAKVAIVEYTDFECPFCKQHHEEAHKQIVKDYVDTGKAILVVRDFPLPFHDPLSTQESLAANCVKDELGDKKYFEYADKLFETTKSNGKGLEKAQLYTLAEGIGANKESFASCLDTEKFKDEIKKDIEDGKKAGVNGTPGFVIGSFDKDGNVDGVSVSGAQPFESFKTVIEEQLAK